VVSGCLYGERSSARMTEAVELTIFLGLLLTAFSICRQKSLALQHIASMI